MPPRRRPHKLLRLANLAAGLFGGIAGCGIDLRDRAGTVVIDLCDAHIWELTSVGALEGVVTKMRRQGKRVELIGMNQASATLVDRHGPLIHADS